MDRKIVNHLLRGAAIGGLEVIGIVLGGNEIVLTSAIVMFGLYVFVLQEHSNQLNRLTMDTILENPQKKKQIQEVKLKSQNLKSLKDLTNSFQEQLKNLKLQAQKMSDPKHFMQGRKKAEQSFLKNIQKIDINLKSNQKQKKIIIGPISVGKSSILKKFLKCQVKVKVGRGQTTLQVSRVLQTEYMQIYDSPGINPDYDINKFQNILQLFQMDEFYVCYNSSLKNVNYLLRVLSSIVKKTGKKIYLVRTQCDSFDEEDQRNLQEELKIDRQYLQKMVEKNEINKIYDIIATSSRKEMQFEGNSSLYKLLNS